MLVNKSKHSSRGSREHDIHYGLATNMLDVKFGVSSHFIPNVCDNETVSENTHYKDIQSMFCGNTEKLKDPQYNDKVASHPSDTWGSPDTIKSLLDH